MSAPPAGFDLATFTQKWNQLTPAQKRATIARLPPEHQALVRNAIVAPTAAPTPPPVMNGRSSVRSEYDALVNAPSDITTPDGKRIITSVFPVVMGNVDAATKFHQLKFLVPSGRPPIHPPTAFSQPVRFLRRDIYNKRQLTLSQGETTHMDAMDSISISAMAKKKPKKKHMETDKLAPSASTWQRTHLFQKKTFRVFKSKIDKTTRERNMEWVLADNTNENVYDAIPGHPTGMEENDANLYGIFNVDGGCFRFTPLDGLYKLTKRRKVIHVNEEDTKIAAPSAVEAVLNQWSDRKKRQLEEDQVKADAGLQLRPAERRVKAKTQKMKVVDRAGGGLFSDDEGDGVDALDELDFDLAEEFQDDEEFNAEDMYYEEANEGNKRQLENYLRAEGLVKKDDEQNGLDETGQYLAMAYSMHDKEGLIGGYKEVRDPYAKIAGVDLNEKKKKLVDDMRSLDMEPPKPAEKATPPPQPAPKPLLTPGTVKQEVVKQESPKKLPEPVDPTLLTAQDLIDVLKTKPSMELKELVAILKPKIQRNLAVNKPLMKTLVRQVAIVKDHTVRLRTN